MKKAFWASLLILLFSGRASAELWVRYDKDTRRIEHVSTVPFTTDPKNGKEDVLIPENKTPNNLNQSRLRADLKGFEIDPELKSAQDAKEADLKNILDSLKNKLRGLGLNAEEIKLILR